MNHNPIAKPSLEALEDRTVPAIMVDVADGSNLTLTVDAGTDDISLNITADNEVEVFDNTNGVFAAGSPFAVNAAGTVTINTSGVSDTIRVNDFGAFGVLEADMEINTDAGSDSVYFYEGDFAGITISSGDDFDVVVLSRAGTAMTTGDVEINTGDVFDYVFFYDNATVNGQVTIDTEDGDDLVLIDDNNIFNGDVNIDLGDGFGIFDDVVVFNNFFIDTPGVIAGDLNITGGETALTAFIDNYEVGGNVTIQTGSLSFTDNTVVFGFNALTTIGGDLTLNGSGIEDTFAIEEATISGSVSMNLGDAEGYANYAYIGSFFPVTIDGNINITGGVDDDIVEIDDLTLVGDLEVDLGDTSGFNIGNELFLGSFAPIDITGSIRFTGGPGDDTFGLDNAVVTGSVTIQTGTDGVDYVYVGDVDMTEIMSGLSIDTGAGDDLVIVDHAIVHGQTSIRMDEGDNNLFLGEESDLDVPPMFLSRVIIQSGEGSDTVEINGADIDGDLLILAGGGDNEIRLNSPLIPANIEVAAAIDIAGDLNVATGSGADSLFIDTELLGVAIGDNATFDLGGGDNLWDLDQDFTVGRNLTISAGSGTDDLTLFASTLGTVGRSIRVSLGHGMNDFTFNGDTRALSYTGGNGEDNVLISGNVDRQVLATLQGGDDTFTWDGGFTFGGSFRTRIDGGSGIDDYDGTMNGAVDALTRPRRFENII